MSLSASQRLSTNGAVYMEPLLWSPPPVVIHHVAYLNCIYVASFAIRRPIVHGHVCEPIAELSHLFITRLRSAAADHDIANPISLTA